MTARKCFSGAAAPNKFSSCLRRGIFYWINYKKYEMIRLKIEIYAFDAADTINSKQSESVCWRGKSIVFPSNRGVKV